MLPPCTVTLADPVDPAFPALNALIRPSATDTPRDKLPTTLPDVIVARRLPCSASPVRHRTDVSESHTDRSQLVLHIFAAADTCNAQKSAPWSVTIIDPVAATLPLCTKLNTASAVEKPRVALCVMVPLVINVRWLPLT